MSIDQSLVFHFLTTHYLDCWLFYILETVYYKMRYLLVMILELNSGSEIQYKEINQQE